VTTKGTALDRKPADARMVMCEPDQEFCLMTLEGGLYQIGGVIIFASREALARVLQRLGKTVDGDEVWL